VVIGIIAVLIAILLPVLGRAKEAANRTRCLANHRQLVAAWNFYADDNRGFLVRSVPAYAKNTLHPEITWIGLGLDESAMINGGLWKYLRTPKVYHCPSDADDHLVSYSINCYLRGSQSSLPIHRRKQIHRPSEIFAFIDHNDLADKKTGMYNCWGFAIQSVPANSWDSYPGWWHSAGACISFVDGHAEYWRWDVAHTLRHDMNDPDASKDLRDLRRLQAVRGQWIPPTPPSP